MQVPLRAARPFVFALIATNCIVLDPPRVDPMSGARGIEETSPTTPTGNSKPDRGVMPKRVTGKQEPNILLAGDGTSCLVTAERYRKVQLGKFEVCAWR
jgi:hypothetical protein